ncbi:hypothetical protein BCR34DRAFT_604009 [Clohesyomyces aquaticus]|uniref:Uncharacterized protein n=1 Tax=Clohesyomyces aquaticus TaxID=1231657 RepID=A0A1Y1ZB44_9PLEO|nr:hypothetical protein BCR34DRAFT_604009 [Clohesyomyces aquaticus]
MEANKPKYYATIPTKPESRVVDISDQEHVLSATAAAAGPLGIRIVTRIRLYVQETGTEIGGRTQVEIREHMSASGVVAPAQTRDMSVDLLEKTDFSGENNGLGRIVGEIAVLTRNLPANFSGELYEEGILIAGDRFFTRESVDWNTAPDNWADGREWYFTQTNSNDQNFKGHLAWQVTITQ